MYLRRFFAFGSSDSFLRDTAEELRIKDGQKKY